jgi:glycine oxidase
VKTFDVAIVGGGLIGVSAAFELAARDLRVVLFDRQQPGREASWAAAGMLAPSPDGPDSAPLVPLAKESFRLYPEFIAAVEGTLGKPCGFARQGTLEIFFGPEGESARDAFIAEHEWLELPAEPIAIEGAREMEPSLGPGALAAAWLPTEATVDPRLLTDAVLSAAQARGVEIRSNCAVTGLRREGDRCAGVLAGSERIAAGHVVLAAGCFCGSLGAEIAQYAPTRPVRGQMLSLRGVSESARGKHGSVRIRRVLRSANGYLVPRADGRILAGSTLEDAEFEKVVTPAGIQKIMSAALELVPSLASAEIVEMWAGLRPGTPDNLPILGPTGLEGLIVATGHYRNGILLAPMTAKLVAAWITGERPTLETDVFSPLRFARRAASFARVPRGQP